MEQCKISNMYTLEETIAKDYLAQFTYPWEALAGIGDYIKELFQIEKGTYLTDYGSVELEAVKGEPKVFVPLS